MKNSELLWNPFRRVAGMKAFGIGIVFVVATVLVGYLSNTVFIGDFQVKLVPYISPGKAFLIQFISLAVIVAVFYTIGRILTSDVRFVDILGTVTLSRWPFIFAALHGFLVRASDPEVIKEAIIANTFSINDMWGLIGAGIIMMGMAVFAAVLLFKAYKASTGLKGGKLWWSFFGAIVVSEVLSGILVNLVQKNLFFPEGGLFP